MSVHAYHPGTQASAVMDDAQLAHMRMSGWVLKSEWDEQQAGQAAADEAAKSTAAKAAKNEGK